MQDPQQLINDLPVDAIEALETLIELAEQGVTQASSDGSTHDEVCDWLTVIGLFCETKGLEYNIPEVTGIQANDYEAFNWLRKTLKPEVRQLRRVQRAQRKRADFRVYFQDQFHYAFDESEQKRIQELLNQLRDLVASSLDFEPAHKQRLLKRLESLQQELHKRLSDLDRFWGLLGDAGVAVGKFGENAKPFMDRVKELSGIVWRAQAKAEALSHDDHPLLPKPDA